MNYRKLGRTGIEVSEIGFGAWQLGDKDWGGVEGKDAIWLVHSAIDQGCTLFDTAPPYGRGQSEKLLGKALVGKRDKVVLISKFGHNPDGPSDFSADKIRSSVERSLKELRTDYLDGLLLHNPESHILAGEESHYEILEALKQEGKIRSYGASVDSSSDLNLVMDHSKSEIAEVYLHALHQEMALAFERVRQENMGIIVKVPLDSGWLTGKYNAQTEFTTGYRDRWSQEIKDRRAAYIEKLAFLKTEGQSMAQGALRFLLSYPEISTLIPGVKNQKQLKDNLSASDQRLPEDQINTIKQLWIEDIRENPLPW